MDCPDFNIAHIKGKHLPYEERVTIQLRLKDCWSPYRIAEIEDWYNLLPRKILGYRTSDEVFNDELDMIYFMQLDRNRFPCDLTICNVIETCNINFNDTSV